MDIVLENTDVPVKRKNNLDKQYQNLLKDILENGIKKGDRTGTGTISVFGRTIRHKMSDGFPLLTTKKMYLKGIITELIWFLKGDTNIKWLVENDCNIWVGDAYQKYCKEFAKGNAPGTATLGKRLGVNEPVQIFSKDDFIDMIKMDEDVSGNFSKIWGELGNVYGAQWRRWNTNKTIVIGHNGHHNEWGTVVIDQIRNLINDLKNNPDSRRLMVNAWNVADIDSMVLPPCHYGFQVYTRELNVGEREEIMAKLGFGYPSTNNREEAFEYYNIPKRAISLMWQQRSVDTFLGLPFNIASYGLLLEAIAYEVNMVPDELIGNLGDTHLYLNHLDEAKIQIEREPYELPELIITTNENQNFSIADTLYRENFNLINYITHPAIKAELSN